MDRAETHVARWRMWSWIVLISLRCFRSTIGFDRLTRLVDAATRVDNSSLAYPPKHRKDRRRRLSLTMAVAGFSPDELDLTVQENSLLVTGKAKKDDEESRYLHRGIARRAFERRFSLADHIKIVGATIQDGMLHVDLARESRGGPSRARSRSAPDSRRR